MKSVIKLTTILLIIATGEEKQLTNGVMDISKKRYG